MTKRGDEMAQHRIAMEYALANGCTPKEAARRLSQERAEKARKALQDKMNTPISRCGREAKPDWSAPWMMQE